MPKIVDNMLQKTPNRTFSGQPIWYEDPSHTEVKSEDLFRGLKNQRRYAAQLDVTVLTHLSLGVELCGYHGHTKTAISYFAAHDMHEAYVLDLHPGMKSVLPRYVEVIEKPWEKHVHESLGLAYPLTPKMAACVKFIDVRSLCVEMHVMGWADWQPAKDLFVQFGPPSRVELAIGRKHLLGNMTDSDKWDQVVGCLTLPT